MNTATERKSLRAKLADGIAPDVYLTSKGEPRSSATVQDRKLADGDARDEARAFWGERLEELARLLPRE